LCLFGNNLKQQTGEKSLIIWRYDYVWNKQQFKQQLSELTEFSEFKQLTEFTELSEFKQQEQLKELFRQL